MRRFTLFIPMLVILAFLVGCGADPSIRAGAWKDSTPVGDFTIYISDDGTSVEKVSYPALKCGDNTIGDSNFKMGESVPLDGRKLNFTVSLAGQVPLAVWTGKFSADGKILSGQLSLFANSCVTDFKITR